MDPFQTARLVEEHRTANLIAFLAVLADNPNLCASTGISPHYLTQQIKERMAP